MKFDELPNGQFEGFALLKQCDEKKTKSGSKYLDLTLSDKYDSMDAKYWNYDSERDSGLKTGDIVKVRGTIEQYNGKDQFKVNLIREISDSDNVNIDDFVVSASYNGEDMFNYLMGLVDKFEDEDLKKIVKTIYEENKELLIVCPAASRMHHAIRGGLMLHTSSIVRLCLSICDVYPFINKELLVSGAILHDIAKTSEFELAKTGLVSTYSKEGNLIGHLVKGAMMVSETAKKVGADEDKALLLEHMIVSHHGIPDYGAAVRPAFLEAEILSQLDLLDARVYAITDATSAVSVGEFTKKFFELDNRKFYKENDNKIDVNLF
ncbi:MAG: HD domain-containing protein [Clostridiales bacterium]|nr:HD domain-containing protein [Clostridiales bacterium]